MVRTTHTRDARVHQNVGLSCGCTTPRYVPHNDGMYGSVPGIQVTSLVFFCVDYISLYNNHKWKGTHTA